jgi:hypothetical protein
LLIIISPREAYQKYWKYYNKYIDRHPKSGETYYREITVKPGKGSVTRSVFKVKNIVMMTNEN